MTTKYACTHIEKLADADHFEQGVTGKPTCTLDQRCNLIADSLPQLIKLIGRDYGLSLEDGLFLPENERGVPVIGFNRLETNDGNEPSADQIEQWKAGRLTLWLCDYSFLIEKREVSLIQKEEFDAEHIKYEN